MLNLITLKGRAEVLRGALEQLWKDSSFDHDIADTTFKELNSRTPYVIHFLTAGHTHLERALPLGPRRFYFNSGTWVRLIKLTADILRSEARFRPAYDAIENGTMASLDKAGLVLFADRRRVLGGRSGNARPASSASSAGNWNPYPEPTL